MSDFAKDMKIEKEKRKRLGHELMGICRGILLDGKVAPEEAHGLLRWIKCNQEVSEAWPWNELLQHLSEIAKDGVVAQEEAEELRIYLENIINPPTHTPPQTTTSPIAAAAAPVLDGPLLFMGKIFVLTGDFEFKTRLECEALVEALGGEVKSGISRKVHYVIVGSKGSEAWAHSTFGRKIEKAKELQSGGVPIAIVSEVQFQAAVAAVQG